MNQAPAYLKSRNKFYEDISISNVFSSTGMFRLPHIIEIQGESESVTEEIISVEKEISENINDTETEYASLEVPLCRWRCTGLHERRQLFSEIRNKIIEENVIIAPRQGKNASLSNILSDKFCEKQAFKGKFGCNVPGDISISLSWYFKERLENFDLNSALNRCR